MSHPARSLLFTLLCISSVALADPPAVQAPVALEVSAADSPGRLRFALRNLTGAAVEIVADRRLLSFVATPPIVPAGTRRRRTALLPRCVHDQRPVLNEFSPRVTLGPGQRYSEEVDVDDLCNLRVPALGPEPLEFRYGFNPPRRGRAPHARSVVTDERPETFAELVVTAPSSLVAVAAPLAEPRVASSSLLTLNARGSSAPSARGLRASVTLRNPSVHAVWTLLRPTQFSFVVDVPGGREVSCDALTRQPAPIRDLFARLPAGGRRGFTLLPSMHCPTPTFQRAGVYRARARFESSADGEPFAMQRVFTGVVESPSVSLRVSRGALVPMDPRFE